MEERKQQMMTETNSNLAGLVANLHNVRKEKAVLDKVEKTILAEIKPMVDPQFDTQSDLGLPVNETVIHAGDLCLSRTMGTSRTIASELLLERGVAPDVIAYATKTTTYFQYRVKENKGG
jgi:hypothetical protein